MAGTDEELKAARIAVEQGKPRPFDLDDKIDLRRLYREASGYLKVCHLKHGTDWEGRKFAIEALEALAHKV